MVALLFCGDLKYCPYISRYIERLENCKIEYKIYFWNRSQFDMTGQKNCDFFDEKANLSLGKAGKISHFIHFRKWLLDKLKKDRPDKLIVLSTITGIMIERYLAKEKIKYILDIRDYSYERIGIYYLIEKRLIKNSCFTAISSKGYKSFLPKNEYVIAHNFNRKDIKKSKFVRKEIPLEFVWNGVVRYFEFQKQYLLALKNDKRFRIVFHGDGPDLMQYKKFCEQENITNVVFTGAYNNSEKARLLNDAAILNNCYGYVHGAGEKIKHSVSNRFYDGIVFHIPQLVEPDGYKEKWINACNIGTSLNPESEFADYLYDYYQKINPSEFDSECDRVLEEILKEDDEYIRKIDEFISM